MDSVGFVVDALTKGVDLSAYGLSSEDLTELKRLFERERRQKRWSNFRRSFPR